MCIVLFHSKELREVLALAMRIIAITCVSSGSVTTVPNSSVLKLHHIMLFPTSQALSPIVPSASNHYTQLYVLGRIDTVHRHNIALNFFGGSGKMMFS